MTYFRPVRPPPTQNQTPRPRRSLLPRMTSDDWWRMAFGKVPRLPKNNLWHRLNSHQWSVNEAAVELRLQRWAQQREAQIKAYLDSQRTAPNIRAPRRRLPTGVRFR